MPIKRLSQTSLVSFQKHSNMLAGNPAFNPNSFDLLETTVLGSNATSVTFSNLNTYSDYKHLQLRLVTGRNLGSTTVGTYYLRFNSDAGANYNYHILGSAGSVFSDGGAGSTERIQLESLAAEDTGVTNGFAAAIIDILDFSNTSKKTTVRVFSGNMISTAVDYVALQSGFWNSTNAVTSLQFGIINNLKANSRFSLYGIK